MLRFLINRDFARLWYGQAISTVGDFVFDTTILVWVAKVLMAGNPAGPAAVSGVGLSALLAIVFVGPVAGVFVDRWNRRRTMLGSEVIRGALVAVLIMVMLLPQHSMPTWAWLAVIYTIVFAVNATGQFFNPARFTAIADIVPDEADRAKAFGLGQATQATAGIIGPPLAAPLLFVFSVEWALLLNALSYVVSYIAIRSVHFPDRDNRTASDPSGPRPKWITEFVAGLRMFAGNRFLVALLTIAVMAQLGTGAMNALDIYFVTENLHVNPSLYGFMSAAFGIGAITGALLSGSIVKILGARNSVWLGLIAGGVMVVLYSRQTAFGFGLLVYFLIAVPIAALNSGISPLMIAVTPREFLGRMSAVFQPINQAASTVSVLTAGVLASTAMRHFHTTIGGIHFGRIDTIFTVAGMLIVIAGTYGAFTLPNPSAGSSVPAIPAQADPLEPVSIIEPAVESL